MIGRRIAATALTLTCIGVGAVPAAAHGNDPTLVPVVRSIEPALPPEVVVQVRTTVSEQMIVANPTTTTLSVLDPDGAEFLRVSATGAEGNIANPFFHRTLNPSGVPPRIPGFAGPGATPLWVDLSLTPNWGWFEPRLHPFEPGTEPRDQPSPWQVGLRYGDRPIRVDGALERRAVTGAFAAALLPRSDDLAVNVVQGPVPALLLVAPPSRRVEVEGRDGRPFLRLDERGAFAHRDSAAFADNPDFEAAPAADGAWARVGEPGRVRWLDPRLRYRADRPPAVVERATAPTEVDRWEIPLRIDGASDPLRGEITWIPAGSVAADPGGGNSLAPWALGGVGVAVAVAVSLAVRRARARPASG